MPEKEATTLVSVTREEAADLFTEVCEALNIMIGANNVFRSHLLASDTIGDEDLERFFAWEETLRLAGKKLVRLRSFGTDVEVSPTPH